MNEQFENNKKEFDDLVTKNLHIQIDHLIDYTVNARVGYEIDRRKNLEAMILDFRNWIKTTSLIADGRVLEEYDKHFGIISSRQGNV